MQEQSKTDRMVLNDTQELARRTRTLASVGDPGFQADRILALAVLPAPERYPSAEKRGLVYKRILDAVRALPAVESAGTADALPFSGRITVGPSPLTEADN